MKAISFAWTTPALLAGRKTVTRREWDDRYAAQFRAGDLVAAYDRQPRYGGKAVAHIRLTETPYRESTALLPDEDWVGEGFAYLESIGRKVNGLTPRELWEAWRLEPAILYVIRFELVEVVAERGTRLVEEVSLSDGQPSFLQ